MKNAVFTICAKNYLAQALTLRESVLTNNNIDFFIYLADKANDEIKDLVEVLDTSWIPKWKEMAFKYNVIEFSTSIKPFCIQNLFGKGYEKVIYLDPDIYVVDSLRTIYDYLENKSAILTPHFCEMKVNYDGAFKESSIMFAGIYNLGFFAIKNNKIGQNIVRWWANRLERFCYNEISEGLFVDQKWMDFLPAMYPHDVLVSDHMGINAAIWNLHERTLIFKDGQYFINRNRDNKLFPLLFFHFSGFDPLNHKLISTRFSGYNISSYPTFAPLLEEYREKNIAYNYIFFSKLTYSFAAFDNGEEILPLTRRLYRGYVLNNYANNKDPFSVEENFYVFLKKNKLLSGHKFTRMFYNGKDKEKAKHFQEKILYPMLKFIKSIIGFRRYSYIIDFAHRIGVKEFHYFLIKK